LTNHSFGFINAFPALAVYDVRGPRLHLDSKTKRYVAIESKFALFKLSSQLNVLPISFSRLNIGKRTNTTLFLEKYDYRDGLFLPPEMPMKH
jgi:hypothetical protein